MTRPIPSSRHLPLRIPPNGGSDLASKCRSGGNSSWDRCCSTETRRRTWRRSRIATCPLVPDRWSDSEEASMTGKFHSVALAFAIALVAAAPAMAQQIGTATAVNHSTEGTPPGGSTTTLTVGARVLHKQRIHTSPTGSVHLLFLHKITLGMAPNTTLAVDEFVYDAAS